MNDPKLEFLAEIPSSVNLSPRSMRITVINYPERSLVSLRVAGGNQNGEAVSLNENAIDDLITVLTYAKMKMEERND